MVKHYEVVEFDIKNKKVLSPRQSLTSDQEKALNSLPAIYVYRSSRTKQIYVGQTIHFKTRHNQHYDGNEEKFEEAKFDEVIVLFFERANGSSLDDIENQLITFFKADNPRNKPYKIINGTGGNEVTVYTDIEFIAYNVILPFWDDYLFTNGWAKDKQTKLRESALVKYSPLKTLTEDQSDLISRVVSDKKHNYVINGDAGTGKTVLLTHMVAELMKDKSKRICVIVQSNWEKTANEIFGIYGMKRNNLVVTTSTKFIKDAQQGEVFYDAVLIDESHRLFRDYRKGIASSWVGIYEGEFSQCKSHLEIIQKAVGSKGQIILMYDVLQSVRPSSITREMFADCTKDYKKEFLKTQFRIKTPVGKSYSSDDYINGIKYLLFKDTGLLESGYTQFDPNFNRDVFRDLSPDAYFGYFTDSPLTNAYQWIRTKGIYNPSDSNRVLAGYVEPWKMADGKDSSIKHWHEGDIHLRWNSSQEGWLNSTDADADEQIGSVYAVQGIGLMSRFSTN